MTAPEVAGSLKAVQTRILECAERRGVKEGVTVPHYEMIGYTRHALTRMAQRRIRHEDVDWTLRSGEGRPGKQGTWIYESGSFRVIVREHQRTATVITVIRLRGKR